MSRSLPGYARARLYVITLCSLFSLCACGQSPEPTASAEPPSPPPLASEPAAAQPPEPQPAQTSRVMAFEGARVIVGDGAVIQNATFTVNNGRFVAIGPTGSVGVPNGATRIDLSGQTVIPALVDAHTHLSTTRDALIDDLRRRAYFGVGAAVSLGADGEGVPLDLREEPIPGAARYRSAGLGITAPEPGRRMVHWVTTEQEAREAVRTEAARDVDLIKIWVDDRDGQYEKLSPALYRAIIDEAHAHDLRVTAHIFALEDAKELLRAGVDMFAHGVRDRDIDAEFVELVRERRNVILVPNLPARGVPTDYNWLEGHIPDDELADLKATSAQEDRAAQESFGIQARNLARLSREGMTIAMGTDGNSAWAPHYELEDMVVAGMSPADVIVAATRNSAQAAGIADMGMVAPGMSADFVVLAGNPLEDIRNTRRITDVYLRGMRVQRRTE